MAASLPGRIKLRRLPDVLTSHEAVQEFVGRDAWLFGVDGDEVYDPAGLAELRGRIIAGEFAGDWMIRAHFLHVCRLAGGVAHGWLAPPSHDPSKLFNMRLVEAWPVAPGRTLFHGTDETLRLRDDLSYFERHRCLNREVPWEKSCFRCLHFRFLPRTARELGMDRLSRPRLNPDDLTAGAVKRRA